MPAKHASIKKVGVSQPYLNMCVVAESGFGKSVLLGSAGAKMLILSVDPEGADSAYFQGSEADEWVIRTFEELENAYKWLRDTGHEIYDWVGVDSIGEVQKLMQQDWLFKNKDKAKGRHPDVLGMDGYQITQNQVVKFVKQMNDLPMHTVYTAKPLEMVDAEGEIYYLPFLHGQKGDVARDFMGYMKIQAFGTYHNKKVRLADKSIEERLVRRFHFSPEGPYRGKDRTDSIGSFLDDPTLPQIAKIVAEKAAAATGSAPAKKSMATRRRATRS